jgi:hypothetical protein
MRVTDRRLAPRNVAAIVKQGAARLGFDPSTFGGRSLRAGFVTSAVKRGANLIKITDVSGQKSLEMLKTYGRDAEAFVRHVETNTLAGKFHAFLIGNGGHSGRSRWLGR